MGRQQANEKQTARPKRRATNAHIYRYLQTRNPGKLEEHDLRRALVASLEECPDYWPLEDTASCSSSEQSNATSFFSCNSSNGVSCTTAATRQSEASNKRHVKTAMQTNHLNQYNPNYTHLPQTNGQHLNMSLSLANGSLVPSVHKRYKPVAKKNIYTDADFFHDGIMEYIEYELSLAMSKRANKAKH